MVIPDTLHSVTVQYSRVNFELVSLEKRSISLDDSSNRNKEEPLLQVPLTKALNRDSLVARMHRKAEGSH